jgi:hypothetical protein
MPALVSLLQPAVRGPMLCDPCSARSVPRECCRRGIVLRRCAALEVSFSVQDTGLSGSPKVMPLSETAAFSRRRTGISHTP